MEGSQRKAEGRTAGGRGCKPRNVAGAALEAGKGEKTASRISRRRAVLLMPVRLVLGFGPPELQNNTLMLFKASTLAIIPYNNHMIHRCDVCKAPTVCLALEMRW